MVGLCSGMLKRLSRYIHLGFDKKHSSHVLIEFGPCACESPTQPLDQSENYLLIKSDLISRYFSLFLVDRKVLTTNYIIIIPMMMEPDIHVRSIDMSETSYA